MQTFHNQFLSLFAPPVATMASLLESTASFKGRAISHGLSEDQVESLVRRGVNSLSKLAFAIIESWARAKKSLFQNIFFL